MSANEDIGNETLGYELQKIFAFDWREANYLINVAQSTGAVYFEIPKAGCSSIKKSLQKTEDKLNGTALMETMRDAHEKAKSPLKSPGQLDTSFKTSIEKKLTFTIVRNPYTRILSCYMDKIIGSEWEKNIRLPKLGLSPATELTFVEFLKLVRKQSSWEMDIHWRPQYSLIGDGNIKFDYIGRFEDFNSSLKKIMSSIVTRNKHLNSEQLDELTLTENWHQTGSASKLEKFYCKEAICLVKEIYKQDFVEFNYSTELEFA